MKLHINKSLRLAVLACMCVSGIAAAAETMKYNDYGNYLLNGGTEYDLSTYKWETTAMNGNLNETGRLYLEGNNVIFTLAEGTVEVHSFMSQASTVGSFEKKGAGTMELAAIEARPESAVISEGTFNVKASAYSNGFVFGTVTVKDGATLQLSASDALGYRGGDYTDTITLESGSTLQVDAHQTLTTNINMDSASIKGDKGDLKFFGGTITATGNSTIDTAIHVAWDANLTVTNATDTLTVSKAITADGGDKLQKRGDGTLVLTTAATVADGITVYVNGGTVEVQGSADTAYQLAKGTTLKLTSGTHTGAEDGSSTKKITLTGNSTIVGNGAAIFNDVVSATTEGESADLTLTKGANVYANVSNNGNVTFTDGNYNLGYSGDYGVAPSVTNSGNITIASDASVKLDSHSNEADATLANGGDIIVNGSLEVSKGTIGNSGTISVSGEDAKLMVNSQASIASDINVTDGGTLDLGNSPTLTTSTITVDGNSTLDLKDTVTLNAEAINLASGATLILGDQPVTITGSLTLGETLTIDLRETYSNLGGDGNLPAFEPFTPIFTYAGDGTFDASEFEGVKVTIMVSDFTNTQGYLTVSEDGKSLLLVPEPTTATLSLLALAGLAARRRRK